MRSLPHLEGTKTFHPNIPALGQCDSMRIRSAVIIEMIAV